MRKPTRQYLADLRNLLEALQRQLAQSTRPLRTKQGIRLLLFTPSQREYQEQLIKLCEDEIERVEKALKK